MNSAGQLDLAGAGLAVLALAGPAFGLGRDHRHAGAVDRDIQLVRQRRRGGSGTSRAGGDRGGLGLDDGGGGRGAVGLGGPLDALAGQA